MDTPTFHSDTPVTSRLDDGSINKEQDTIKECLNPIESRSLKKIGFSWENLTTIRFERIWNEKFARLEEYKREHGDCLVPHIYKEDRGLGFWVSDQRKLNKRNLLREDRKRKLDDLGMVWIVNYNPSTNQDTTHNDKQFEEMYNLLEAFHQQHGHTMAPQTNGNGNERSPLGVWVGRQRTNYARGILREDRRAQLDKLGFVWKIDYGDSKSSPNQQYWEKMLDRLKGYHARHGNVLAIYKEDTKLASWISQQRYLFRHNKLLPDRKARLEAIGFPGDPETVSWTRQVVQRSQRHGRCF